jgi:hypothetical protein
LRGHKFDRAFAAFYGRRSMRHLIFVNVETLTDLTANPHAAAKACAQSTAARAKAPRARRGKNALRDAVRTPRATQ